MTCLNDINGLKPRMMARTALAIAQGSPTESSRDFAMPFPVPYNVWKSLLAWHN